MEALIKFSVGDKTKQIRIEQAKYVIGRSEDCQLRIKSDSISRKHCCLRRRSHGYEIVDLKSRNGTTVNGQPVEPGRGHPLKSGDRVQLGSFSFEVVIPHVADDDLQANDDSELDLRQWLADARSTSRDPITEEIAPANKVFNLPASEANEPEPQEQSKEKQVDFKTTKEPPKAKSPSEAAVNAIRNLFRS